jgi:Spy/CpxP family protein refolding chaperone
MKMLKMNLNKVIGMALLAFVLLLGTDIYAQHDSMSKANNMYKQNAQKWTTELSQKVKLTQEQQTQIEGILVNYQQAEKKSDMKNVDQLHATYNSKIESVLNNNQKKLYKDYSKQWWKSMSWSNQKSTKQKKY